MGVSEGKNRYVDAVECVLEGNILYIWRITNLYLQSTYIWLVIVDYLMMTFYGQNI
jgi:hypothetical protein